MIKEFCAENHTDIARALAMGANRIELCDNLAVGGTTPSLGVVESVCRLAHEQGAQVVTMIRPRGGDFYYDEMELAIMRRDMDLILAAGSDGIVLGALTKENWLDETALSQLVKDVKNKDLVFHMAFDQIPRSRQKEALDWLAEHGFTRILTHGGRMDKSIENHVDWLKELVDYAKDRITILIGGGVTANNYEELAKTLGVTEVHGTNIV